MARNERWLAALCSVVVAALQWFPAWRRPSATGYGDWQMVHHNWEAAYVALTRFGEWPLWDPFHCGGIPILGNPESQLYSPFFLVSFLGGTVVAVKVFLVAHVAAGLLGMYVLGRAGYALRPIPSALAAVGWACSGCFAWDGAGGHATFLPFAFAPWLVLCFRHAEQSPRALVGLVLLLGLTLVEGGTYPFPYFLILLGFELIRRLAVEAQRARAARVVLVSGVLVLLTGAIRLVPIHQALSLLPRTVDNADSLTPLELLTMYVARSHPWRVEGHRYVWAEYGSYVGWPIVALAVIGIALLARQRRQVHLAAGLLLFSALAMGNFSPLAPWSLLHQLPVYDSLRVPSRFAVLTTFYMALLAAHAAERLHGIWSGRAATVVATLALLGCGADVLGVNFRTIDRWSGAPLSDQPPATEFHLVRENYGRNYASYPRRNVGTRVCYNGGMNWPVAPGLWDGHKPQARISRALGSVVASNRTTTRVWADVRMQQSGLVLFNQNAADGWRSAQGEVVNSRGLLAVQVPAGARRVEVSYRPAGLLLSVALSLVGLCVTLALLWPNVFRAIVRRP
jgi:hypothetical protein